MLSIVIFIVFAHFFIWALDRSRIKKYFSRRGEAVQSITWRIFGRGWLSESGKEGGGNRIYEVEYLDVYGNLKHVWCKTAMLSGVFLSDEKIIAHADVEGRELTAEEKVVLLEDQIRQLRSNSGRSNV